MTAGRRILYIKGNLRSSRASFELGIIPLIDVTVIGGKFAIPAPVKALAVRWLVRYPAPWAVPTDLEDGEVRLVHISIVVGVGEDIQITRR